MADHPVASTPHPVAGWLPALAVAVAGFAALAWWSTALDRPAPPPRLPGSDRPAGSTTLPVIDLAGRFIAGSATAADLAGSWPGFRGPSGDNQVAGGPALQPVFAPSGPRVLWSIPLGYGYAAPAVEGGRVYLLDYDQAQQADALRCLSLADGAELWRRSYPVRIKFNHGMSRTIPAVGGGAVVSIGPKCHVLCVDAISGAYRWGIDLVREHGTREPPWYAGQCPLIDGGRAILAPAGPRALLMAVDLATGATAWTTPNPGGWTMTHSSVSIATLGGRRQYLYCGSGGVAGVDAADGRLLWMTTAWKVDIANVPTPVPCGGDRVFLCGGYGAGSAMLGVRMEGQDWTPEVLFRLKARDFGSDQQTPILVDGHLYGVTPDGQAVCLDLDGRRRWSSGSASRFGLGPYVAAGGALWLLDDHGWLTTAALDPSAWKPLARSRILAGHDAWGPLAIAGTRLLARDLATLVCLDIGASTGGDPQ